jgi:hypothetical protein
VLGEKTAAGWRLMIRRRANTIHKCIQFGAAFVPRNKNFAQQGDHAFSITRLLEQNNSAAIVCPRSEMNAKINLASPNFVKRHF